MKKPSLRTRASALRMKGMSYNAIATQLSISKSTLSGWFKGMPLSKERVLELRAHNPVRIQKFQETMRRKRIVRQKNVYERISKSFKGDRMSRDQFAGYFLYWAEGTKSAPYTVALTNSDPSMLIFFVSWLGMLGVPHSGLRVKLHLYSDMDIESSQLFWSRKLGIPVSQFYKPYVKTQPSTKKTYKGMFGRGTCTVLYHNRDVYEHVLAGVAYLRESVI